jgi:hypothetical protein
VAVNVTVPLDAEHDGTACVYDNENEPVSDVPDPNVPVME